MDRRPATPSPRPPLVSVVVPVHDRAATVLRAVESVLGQTVADLEVIVVDDASTDATPEVLGRIPDPRVRVIRHEENRGGSAARNTGADAARGTYVAFLDSDDEWLPGHLERRIAVLEREGADGVFGSFWVETGGRAVPRACCPRRPTEPLIEYILSGRGDVRSSTLLLRREAIREVPFDPGVRKHQDWDLAARADGSLRLACDPEPTAVLHADAGGRMTARLDPGATAAFLARHEAALSPGTLARFHTVQAIRALRAEGRSAAFHASMAAARTHRRAAAPGIRLAISWLSIAGAARLFLALHDLRVRLRSPARRPAPGAAAAGAAEGGGAVGTARSGNART